MSKRSFLLTLGTSIATLFIVLILSASLAARQNAGQQASRLFNDAHISMDKEGNAPVEIRFQGGKQVALASFFEIYKQAFNLSEDNELHDFRIHTDKLGQTHHRCKQYYKGVEVAEAQYLLHEKNGSVFYANGRLIHGLDLNVKPVLSEQEALAYALDDIHAESYMWQSKKNEAFLKREQNNPAATFYPKAELKISAGHKDQTAENFRLVYRFDIYAEKPLGRYYVDVDAKTGEIVGKTTRIHTKDVLGEGLSLYDGMVAITVADSADPVTLPSRWHLDTWNAFGGSGESWWMADPSLGNAGGYDNEWYEVLDTAPITLTGTNIALTFFHRYAVETPGGEPPGYDGWDGMNVRISTDGGATWEVLTDPTPAYSDSSLYSFGEQHGEGFGIPGWTDRLLQWTPVSFDLSAYAGETVRIRFAFASDPGLATTDGAPDLFGWQIDDIVVSNASETLFSNSGVAAGMRALNNVQNIIFTPGNFRLRETGRGGGLATYDVKNGTDYTQSVDFVDNDSSFTEANAGAGVNAHWATEATYDYYLLEHGRNSVDDAGFPLISYVHYDDGFFNAFWDGTRMTYGDGNGNLTPLTTIDITAHEITHGVTEFTASLIYANESGALNESFSDIFGNTIEIYKEGADASWLIGEDIGAIRSMEDPGSFGDPDTYLGNRWVPSTTTPDNSNDNGGVHQNSGVQNYWFYLLTEGGSGTNDNGKAYSVTGIGIEDASQIAYRNLTVYLRPNSGFFDARLGSINAAVDLFGSDSPQVQSVIDAWFAVGVERPFLDQTVSVSADTLDFLAEVAVATDTAKLTISNYGLQALTLNDVQLSGSGFELLTSLSLPMTLEYEDEIPLEIVFSASKKGEASGTLAVVSSDPENPTKSVYLRGSGFVVSPAQQGVIYAVSGREADGVLLTLDQNSGGGQVVGLSGFDELTGVSIRPSTGELYATVATNLETQLLRMDSETGQAFETAVIPVPNIRAIAFDSNGDLYGATFDKGDLYLIDAATGDATLIGSTGVNLFVGLAVNPIDGQLWGTGVTDAIYQIDKTTAETTLIGNTGFSRTPEIEFDAGGKLFGLSGFAPGVESELIQIDTSTAAGTLIGATGFKTVFALAISGVVVTGIESVTDALLPAQFALHQNYPNPFNPNTIIRYDLPRDSEVLLKIYNALGQQVRTLVQEKQAAGFKSVEWDGRDDAGRLAGSGVYIYRLTAGQVTLTNKMLFLK